jgi:hypothetical protein
VEREAQYYTEAEYDAMVAEYRDTVLLPHLQNTRPMSTMLLWSLDRQARQDGIRLMYLTTYYGMPAVMDGIREEAKQGKVNTIWLERWLAEQEVARS